LLVDGGAPQRGACGEEGESNRAKVCRAERAQKRKCFGGGNDAEHTQAEERNNELKGWGAQKKTLRLLVVSVWGVEGGVGRKGGGFLAFLVVKGGVCVCGSKSAHISFAQRAGWGRKRRFCVARPSIHQE
jgi:hypothetical protein